MKKDYLFPAEQTLKFQRIFILICGFFFILISLISVLVREPHIQSRKEEYNRMRTYCDKKYKWQLHIDQLPLKYRDLDVEEIEKYRLRTAVYNNSLKQAPYIFGIIGIIFIILSWFIPTLEKINRIRY